MVFRSSNAASAPKRDRNDRINLDDWNSKPGGADDQKSSDERQSLANLKQKMAEKEEQIQQKEYKKRWSAMAESREENQVE